MTHQLGKHRSLMAKIPEYSCVNPEFTTVSSGWRRPWWYAIIISSFLSLHAKKSFCHFSSPSRLFYILPIFFGEPLKQTAHPAALSCYTCQLHMSNHPALLLLMTSLWYLLVGSPHSTPLLSAVLSALSPHSTLSASHLILTLAHWLLVTLHLHSPYYTLTSHPSGCPSFLCQLTSVSSPAVFTLLSLVF